ncbi:MAG: hypothetical protein K9W45_00335 [Candidatus Heimdallarchaeum aukensis]|uniref:Uncharacterized protein n=1 Tax=Candidatus Heimdallarchaeum aukensis TaxID=2876573 RepID=A0A9Y1BKV5_9ARCH|nr:MAG: hypothetical protein K9W45_00335 [Candidatus Heimdallarchaeum aukensis]
MSNIKKLTFSVNQSRRVIRAAENKKIEPKELLKGYELMVNTLFKHWKEEYAETMEIDFQTFFYEIMKYAEVKYRLEKTKSDLKKIKEMSELLNEAIEEYKEDYTILKAIEDSLRNMGVEWV